MSIIQASGVICENDDTNSDRGYGAMKVKRCNKTVARVYKNVFKPIFNMDSMAILLQQQWNNVVAALRRKEQQVLINKLLQSILDSSGSQ